MMADVRCWLVLVLMVNVALITAEPINKQIYCNIVLTGVYPHIKLKSPYSSLHLADA